LNSERFTTLLHWLRIAGFGMLLVAMPFSNNWMSISTFVLAGVWILERAQDTYSKKPLAEQFRGFVQNKPLLFFTSLYGLLLLGLTYTSDFKYANWDLQMKLPLLFMPMLVSTLRPLNKRTWDALWMVFLAALLCSVFIGLLLYFYPPAQEVRYLGIKYKPWKNVREVSVFISHIRFSLMLVFGLCVLWLRFYRTSARFFVLVAYTLLVLFYLWLIESATAYVLLFALVGAMLVRLAMKSSKRILWMALLGALVVLPTAFISYKVKQYFAVKESRAVDTTAVSAGGELYFSLPENTQLENGYYILRYIAWDELRRSWKNVSGTSLDASDELGNPLSGTVVRYLTSMGLRKDSVAVYSLKPEDIERIKRGVTNVEWKNKTGIEQRIDRILYEIDSFHNGGSANGHSVLQRLEFWRAGLHIVSSNLLYGVGTGDVKDAYALSYAEIGSSLDQEHQLRAHNQYLTFFVAFGLLGGLWFLWVCVYLWRSAPNRLASAFLIIVFLSYLTEDTLETQAGVTLVVFFTSLLFSSPVARQLDAE
jgi:hypothetical protein